LTLNDVESTLKGLAKQARQGKLTYFYCLAQFENDDFVEWRPIIAGDKSHDSQHLLAEIGHYYVITQAVFEDICQMAEEDDEGID